MQSKKTRKEVLAEKRKKRRPVSGRVQKLAFDDVPSGYVARWVNDKDRRVQDFLSAGWEFLTNDENTVTVEYDDMGTLVRRRVDKQLSGEPLYAYLMVIEEELYNEDQQRKQDNIDAMVEDLERGEASGLGGKIDGRTTYVKNARL